MFDEVNAVFQKLPFWTTLAAQEQEILLGSARVEVYGKGDQVSHTAQGCKGPIVVLSGQIRAYILSEEGREVTLYRLHEGDICALSASCILNSITFDVVIEAVENTRVMVIPALVFHELQEKNPQLELYLLRIANERFSDVLWTMQQILFMGTDRRVAIFLWDELSRTDCQDVLITQDELARFIGTAREVVSRVLKYFAEEGIVRLSRGKITIVDKKKLKKLV